MGWMEAFLVVLLESPQEGHEEGDRPWRKYHFDILGGGEILNFKEFLTIIITKNRRKSLSNMKKNWMLIMGTLLYQMRHVIYHRKAFENELLLVYGMPSNLKIRVYMRVIKPIAYNSISFGKFDEFGGFFYLKGLMDLTV